MTNGWIKVHRALLDHGIFYDAELLQLWMYCLLQASYREQQLPVGSQIVHLKPGQLLYGRTAVSRRLGISEGRLRRCMTLLEQLGAIVIERTNRYSKVTIVNWALYQNGKAEFPFDCDFCSVDVLEDLQDGLGLDCDADFDSVNGLDVFEDEEVFDCDNDINYVNVCCDEEVQYCECDNDHDDDDSINRSCDDTEYCMIELEQKKEAESCQLELQSATGMSVNFSQSFTSSQPTDDHKQEDKNKRKENNKNIKNNKTQNNKINKNQTTKNKITKNKITNDQITEQQTNHTKTQPTTSPNQSSTWATGHWNSHSQPGKADTATLQQAQQMMERLWQQYPVRKGRHKITDQQILRLYQVGEARLEQSIADYKRSVQYKDQRYWQHGSTFFNGGYLDYLDLPQPTTPKWESL